MLTFIRHCFQLLLGQLCFVLLREGYIAQNMSEWISGISPMIIKLSDTKVQQGAIFVDLNYVIEVNNERTCYSNTFFTLFCMSCMLVKRFKHLERECSSEICVKQFCVFEAHGKTKTVLRCNGGVVKQWLALRSKVGHRT